MFIENLSLCRECREALIIKRIHSSRPLSIAVTFESLNISGNIRLLCVLCIFLGYLMLTYLL